MLQKDANSKKKVSEDYIEVNTSGSTNEHEILKEANIDDSEGIMKYGVDLSDNLEKM